MSKLDGMVLKQATELLIAVTQSGNLASISDSDLQALFAAVVRCFAAKVDAAGPFPAFDRRDAASATEVAMAVTSMLDTAGIATFELGMWQTIKGHK